MRGRVLGSRGAVAIVAGAFAWVGGIGLSRPPNAPAAPSATSTRDASALVARLAVLRRAQTPADVLPSDVRLPRQAQATVVPALTRLVATSAGTSLYLAVFTPAHLSLPFWSPRLGDQVALVAVTTQGAQITWPVPAAELTDGSRVTSVGARPRPAGQAGTFAEIVPDGVARVVWTFVDGHRKHRRVVDGQVANNVVIATVQTGSPYLLHATWYAANGAVIPTSDSALRHATAARDDILRKRLLRRDFRIRYRTASALLAAFAVFDVTSRTGVKVGDLTISHPALSSLPLAILSITAHVGHPGFAPELNPSDSRKATTGSGVSAYIIPGAHGLCVAEVAKSTFPLYGSSAGMACTHDLALALSSGSGLTSGHPGGVTWHYGVLPRSKPTLTIRFGPHHTRTIRPPDGVYIYRTAR